MYPGGTGAKSHATPRVERGMSLLIDLTQGSYES